MFNVKTRDGDYVDSFWTQEAAEEAIRRYEAIDRKDECYEAGFYRIVPTSPEVIAAARLARAAGLTSDDYYALIVDYKIDEFIADEIASLLDLLADAEEKANS